MEKERKFENKGLYYPYSDYLKEKYAKKGNVYLGMVHRLDRPVGGLMVFAKTSKAAKRLSLSIQNHEFKKEYLAVVKGNIPGSQTLKNYLGRKGKVAYVTDEKMVNTRNFHIKLLRKLMI